MRTAPLTCIGFLSLRQGLHAVIQGLISGSHSLLQRVRLLLRSAQLLSLRRQQRHGLLQPLGRCGMLLLHLLMRRLLHAHMTAIRAQQAVEGHHQSRSSLLGCVRCVDDHWHADHIAAHAGGLSKS